MAAAPDSSFTAWNILVSTTQRYKWGRGGWERRKKEGRYDASGIEKTSELTWDPPYVRDIQLCRSKQKE